MPAPYVFSDTDLTDIRRYCGYPVLGTGVIVFPFPWWFKYYQALQVRLQNLTSTEAAVVQTYLTQLRGLESAVPGAGANLDTDKADVWTHNKQEVADRVDLYNRWRLELCGILGLPPGDNLKQAGTFRMVV
jgi:hypothetical protein